MQCLHSEIIKIKSNAAPSSTLQIKDQKVDRIEEDGSLGNSNPKNNTRNRSKEGSRLSMKQSHDDKASENQEISDSSGIFSQSPGSAADHAVVTGIDKPKNLSFK